MNTTPTLRDLSAEDVKAAASGDAKMLEIIAEALRKPSYNVALRMTGNHDDAQDAAQEAMIRVITRLGSFRGDSLFSTWAWTVIARAISDHISRNQKHQKTLSFEDFRKDLSKGADLGALPETEDKIHLWQVKIGCARAMLQCLDLDSRAAYVLGEIMEMDAPTAGQILGLAPATFRKRLSRAREKLYDHLRKTCGIVDAKAPCRCAHRLKPARALGRLDPRDRPTSAQSVEALSHYVHRLTGLSKTATYFLADPTPQGPQVLTQIVLEACRLETNAPPAFQA